MSAITVVIPARDEEIHIERCVRAALCIGPVFVVDALSTDATGARAEAAGATVVTHRWEGYAAQKNWALDNLDLRTPWILLLDADEWVEADDIPRLHRAVAATDAADGFYLPRRNRFLGRQLNHAWWYPDFQLRLFRHGRARYEERGVHEHMLVDGSTRELWVDIQHENLKGLSAFVVRHDRYATLEARERVDPSAGQRTGSLRGNWADRRRFLKRHVWTRVPGKPVVRFLHLYVFKRGFLDGRAGWYYCALVAWYDLLIDAKVYELRVEARRQRDEGALKEQSARAPTPPSG